MIASGEAMTPGDDVVANCPHKPTVEYPRAGSPRFGSWDYEQTSLSVVRAKDIGPCECCGEPATGCFSAGRFCAPCGVLMERERAAKEVKNQGSESPNRIK